MVLVVDRAAALGCCTGQQHWVVALDSSTGLSRWRCRRCSREVGARGGGGLNSGPLPVCSAGGQESQSTMMFAEDIVMCGVSRWRCGSPGREVCEWQWKGVVSDLLFNFSTVPCLFAAVGAPLSPAAAMKRAARGANGTAPPSTGRQEKTKTRRQTAAGGNN